MEKGKRIGMLLISLFVFSQTILAHTPTFDLRPETKTALFFRLAPTSIASAFFANPHSQVTDLAFQVFTDKAGIDTDEHKEFHYCYVKCKKKYKRIQPSTCKIKAPVRVATVFLPPFEKGFYTRPHFLLHLHHFLFRLTPF